MKILYTDEMNCNLSYEFFILVAEAVFNELDMSNNEYEISLLITDDETIRQYNKEYRNKDSNGKINTRRINLSLL